MISLAKTLRTALWITGLLLFLVLLLGLRQQQMTSSYREIITRGEKMVFRFNSLRDHLTLAMLEQQWSRFRATTTEIEALNRDLLTLLDSPLVPGSFKTALIDGIDIQAIGLVSRKLAEDRERRTLVLKLNEQMRVMADQLLRLDRVLTGRMNQRLIQFQKTAIGALTLITGVTGLLLVLLYKKAIGPLLKITEKLKWTGQGPLPRAAPGGCREIHELTSCLNRRFQDREESGELVPDSVPAGSMNSISNLLNAIINYSQLLLDEYCGPGTGGDQSAMLEKIISHSERISELLRPGHNRSADRQIPRPPAEDLCPIPAVQPLD